MSFIYIPPEGSPDLPASIPLPQFPDWEEAITKMMIEEGWTKDRDDETTLGFSFKEGDHHWIKDYNKKTKSFVHYDGNVMVTLRCTKEVNSE